MTGEALLHVSGLTIDYQTDDGVVPAVHDVSLSIDRGEVVALVGESGSGKSTTAHALLRLLAANARVASGHARLSGVDLLTLPERQLRHYRGGKIGFIPQDPSVSLNPVKRIGEQIAETLRLHQRLSRAAAAERAVDLLREVGLDRPEYRVTQYPHELSGGMRQRVLIAIAISCNPVLVIADEPTSALDVTVQRTVLDRLEGLVKDAGAALLLITHDLGVAGDRADRIVVLRRGRVVEVGSAAQILTAPIHPYSRKLIEAAPSLNSARLRADRPVDHGRVREEPGSPLLRVEHLTREFADSSGSGSTLAVNDVSFDIARGRTLALVGESGSGKSTTARIVGRLETADSGRVELGGVDVTALHGKQLRQFRSRVQVVHQNPYGSLDPRHSVRRTIDEALVAAGTNDRAERGRKIASLMNDVALARTTLERRPRELSGGQRQRVAIARALAVNPEVLILDEPVSALDVSVQDEILRLLAELQRERSFTYLFISHDLAVVRLIADEVAVMRQGEIIERGDPDKLLRHPRHPYTTELVNAIPGRKLVPLAVG